LIDLPKATKLVFSRLPFVFITLGVCLENFTIAAATTFMPKVMQTQFYLPPGKAALLYGVIAVPFAFFGNFLGENSIQNSSNFFLNNRYSHWLLWGHVTSDNETVCR